MFQMIPILLQKSFFYPLPYHAMKPPSSRMRRSSMGDTIPYLIPLSIP
ncbi:hypothetical protein KNP414_06067 [Paenibacillus mucilaginosus KNP414]|uniref:Uncharacterized protein n=1 Tax=Paenibacillus mucilaginosus (strain KNP414) TaxID=1036673 RepID=F8FGD1_PAEMK|nr:hypothetical protein KNP414_06067 [Paenibacillus mucilaginosus KNP414]